MATTHYIPSQRRIFLNAALAVLLATASACSLVRGSAPTQTPTGPVTFPSVAPTPFAKLLMTEALPPPQEAPPQATEPETVETIPWTGIGPWVNIRDLVIDPRMPLILYAGTDGGMFKSTNGGQSWAAINDGLADPYIEDVVMDPATPATLYVAIGYSTPDGGGVFKSTDGGDHWSAARNGLPHHVSKLAIDPRTPTTLYAVTYFDQVYKSTNGGRSWSPAFIGLALDNPALVLVVDPITPNTLYLGTYRNGVYKSVDGGGHWNPASMGIDLDTTYENSVDELVMDPLTPSTLYAVTRYEGIFKTTNGGRDWMAFDPGFAPSVWGYSNLTLDPITPATMYLEGYELYKSTDGGRSWQAYYATGLPNMFISVVAVDPLDTSILYVGTEGGGIFTNRTYDSFVSVQMPTLTPPPAAATEAPVAAVPVPTEAPAVGVPAPTEPLILSVKSTLAPLAFPFTVRGPLRYQKDVQLPPNARVLVLWSVTAEYPDYGYIFGEGTIDSAGSSFELTFDEPPPSEVLNWLGSSALGVGVVILTTDQTLQPGKILSEDFSEDQILGASGQYNIIYVNNGFEIGEYLPWYNEFNPGYGLGKGVDVPDSVFDAFEPVDPGTMEIIIDDLENIEFVNWT